MLAVVIVFSSAVVIVFLSAYLTFDAEQCNMSYIYVHAVNRTSKSILWVTESYRLV